MKKILERLADVVILGSLLFGFVVAAIKIIEQSTWYVN